MGLYEGIKDAIGLAQKADNIDLFTGHHKAAG